MRQTMTASFTRSTSTSPSRSLFGSMLGIAFMAVIVCVADGWTFLLAADRSPGSWGGFFAGLVISIPYFALCWTVVLVIVLVAFSPLLRWVSGGKSLLPFLIASASLPLSGWVANYIAATSGWFARPH